MTIQVIQQLLQIAALICWALASFFVVVWTIRTVPENKRGLGIAVSPVPLGLLLWHLSEFIH